MREIQIIGHIHNSFGSKFGLPRQGGLADHVSVIDFLPAFRNADAFRGLEQFSHIWVLWLFDQAKGGFSPTVRPPRLGGNRRMGVFATRSPNRPSPIGLSALALEKIEFDPVRGPLLYVIGADAASGTPVLDIKPYLPFADSIPTAEGSFATQKKDYALTVEMEKSFADKLSDAQYHVICQLLSQDPRPAYQTDASRVYGFEYDGNEISFRVEDMRAIVVDIRPKGENA